MTDDKLARVLAQSACEANADDDFRCTYPTCPCESGGHNFAVNVQDALAKAGYTIKHIGEE